VNPLDLIPQKARQKLLDEVLTRAAEAADRSGSRWLGDQLRDIRSAKPFMEDVLHALGTAAREYVGGLSPGDPSVDCFQPSSQVWADRIVLQDLMQQLLLPRATGFNMDVAVLHGILLVAPAGLTEAEATQGYQQIVGKVRDILFAHPALREVNRLLLERAGVMLQSQQRPSAVAPGIGTEHAIPQGSIERGTVADPAVATVPSVGASRSRLVLLVPRMPEGHAAPDIVTPKLVGSDSLKTVYAATMGEEAASAVGDLSAAVVKSITDGRFEDQLFFAKQLREIDPVRFREMSSYLAAEGSRIGADFVKDPLLAARMRGDAAASYAEAMESPGGSPRALRGIGRVQEVSGDIGAALDTYRLARGQALAQYYEKRSRDADAAHEVLRSTRHYVACLGAVLLDDPGSTLATEDGMVELHGATLESERLHREVLPRFDAPDNWTLIEWFMGSVLLSRGYAGAGDCHRAHDTLVRALEARVRMLASPRVIDVVFLGNLRWWCAAARRIRGWSKVFDRQVEGLEGCLESGNESGLWSALGEVLQAGSIPWIIRDGRTA
jgi:hypothetical protein